MLQPSVFINVIRLETGINIDLGLPHSLYTSNSWLNVNFNGAKAYISHIKTIVWSHLENVLFFQQKKFHWCVLSTCPLFCKLFKGKLVEQQSGNNNYCCLFICFKCFEDGRVFFSERSFSVPYYQQIISSAIGQF